jgi:tRNA threonylcarbamoyladenosine biosynthesis protein TsaB
MPDAVSIAIETSCRLGGIALGVGDALRRAVDFDASSRHATALVARLADLLAGEGFAPRDLGEVHVSVGPGSFTGTRIAVTVARTLCQSVPGLRGVAVETPAAVAEGAADLPWQHLAVVLDAREGLVHATLFDRAGADIAQRGPGEVLTPAELLDRAPRPLTLLGEGLEHHEIAGEGVTALAPNLLGRPPHLPTAAAVWRLGRRAARDGRFTEYHHLLPIYSRKPEAVRLWERLHGQTCSFPRQAGGGTME